MKNLIYGLFHPETDECRYVGQSSVGMKRPLMHLRKSHNKEVNKWVQELLQERLVPVIKILEYCDKSELNEKELFYIAKLINEGNSLFNVAHNTKHIVHDIKMVYENRISQLTETISAMELLNPFLSSYVRFNVGKCIKERRKVLKINQTDLSEISGVAIHSISDIEGGIGNPTMETVNKLLDVLGLRLIITLNK